MTRRDALALMVCFSLVSSLGCSGSEDPKTTSNNTQPDMAADMPAPSNNTPTQWASDYKLIFLDMSFKPGTPGAGTLNTVLRKSFRMDEEYPTIILVDIKDIDPEAGTTRVKGGAGQVTAKDGEFSWDPETPDVYYDGTLAKDTGVVTGTFKQFQFIATIPTEGEPLRVTLPIQDLAFTATLFQSSSGVSITGGELTGFLTKAQGDTIEIFLNGMTLSLTALLRETTLNLDTDNDGTPDAWRLEATFKAGPAVITN